MAKETLLTASRRVHRFINIDIGKGELITEDTQRALITLNREVSRNDEFRKKGRAMLAANDTEGLARLAVAALALDDEE